MHRFAFLTGVALLAVASCAPKTHVVPCDPCETRIPDRTPLFSHRDGVGKVCEDSLLAFAHEITKLEDDILNDGTITAKAPDVWGDANLMAFIQEYDLLMKQEASKFDATLSAFIARSDQYTLQSTTSLGMALSNGQNVAAPAPQVPTVAATLVDLPDENTQAFGFLKAAIHGFQPASDFKLAIEPNEQLRQESTYILVNQALRRRNAGDDNTQAPGYGLYKFHIPISVLPGRHTARGYSAVATFRARLVVDETNLRTTIPKLAIAELVDNLDPYIREHWNDSFVSEKSTAKPSSEDPALTERTPSGGPISYSLDVTNVTKVYGQDSIDTLRRLAQEKFGKQPPKSNDLRAFLFDQLGYAHVVMDRVGAYQHGATYIMCAAETVARGGSPVTSTGLPPCTKPLKEEPCFSCGQFAGGTSWRCQWLDMMCNQVQDCDVVKISWLVAIQTGLLNENLKTILKELAMNGVLTDDYRDAPNRQDLQFFNPEMTPVMLPLWQTIVNEMFPIHVFALDPQIEEQNVYDAFSRQRLLQWALAFGVASGRFNMQQRLAASRQLALDMATIAYNRTVVGFTHGNDTFGWYFHPRVQTPPEESSRIMAFLRMIWSTGPTRHYDLSHRRLEPGIRECEVLVAMPGFVSQVAFDMTTNWEKVTCPGSAKRSYESMVEQGGRLHRLRTQLTNIKDLGCYRPGDYERLLSRLDQLEHMLGLQIHYVRVPYQYEIAGSDLFDKGDQQLRPVLFDYYGLDFVATGNGKDACFFLSGKNFHPTLTHVIVGGYEAHSLLAPDRNPAGSEPQPHGGALADVEVISRETLRVRVKDLNAELSLPNEFTVRVATPAGISNPLTLRSKTAQTSKSEFSWAPKPLTGWICISQDGNPRKADLYIQVADSYKLEIANNSPITWQYMGGRPRVQLGWTAVLADGKTVSLPPTESEVDHNGIVYLTDTNTWRPLKKAVRDNIFTPHDVIRIASKSLLRIDGWPYIELGPITIELSQQAGINLCSPGIPSPATSSNDMGGNNPNGSSNTPSPANLLPPMPEEIQKASFDGPAVPSRPWRRVR